MSRTMKRVPMDFTWPTGMIWKGYLNPYRAQPCKPCEGKGWSPQARVFFDQWYGHTPFDPIAYGALPLAADDPKVIAFAQRNVGSAPGFYGVLPAPSLDLTQEGLILLKGNPSWGQAVLREADRLWRLWRGQWCHHLNQADVDALVEADRLWDFTRRPLNDEQRAACHGNGWTKEPNGYRPTAAEVNAWSIGGLGHDSINAHVCIEARCKRESVPMHCDFCKGSGSIWQSPEIEKLHDEWESFDPPTGEGYQLWETTSEGSPQSPVFASIDELCAWCEGNATTFGAQRTTAALWKRMFE